MSNIIRCLCKALFHDSWNLTEMKNSILIASITMALAAPALADEKFPLVSFEESAANLVDVSQCDKKYVEKIVEAKATEFDGMLWVFVYTALMVSETDLEYSGDIPAVGPLKVPATKAQVDWLIGKYTCTEPF